MAKRRSEIASPGTMITLTLAFVAIVTSAIILESYVPLRQADPLDRLADRIEAMPLYRWGFNIKVYRENQLPETAKRLALAADYLGVTVRVEPPPPGISGAYSDLTRSIILDPALPETAQVQVQVLAHELCHVIQPPFSERWEAEIYADACAYLVTRPEYDDLDTFAAYLARYRTMARDVLRTHASHVRWAANFLRMEPR